MTKGVRLTSKGNAYIRYTDGMAAQRASAKKIRQIFRTLEASMGQQHWWPASSAFEVIVGAYLTQNTAWANVERAMGNLRGAGVLSMNGIRDTPLQELELLVRPAGYFRQKAARLKQFVAHLDAKYAGSLDALFERPTEALREELLGLPGIGPETADSILLYAASREVFVVDTYTRRIFGRHGLAEADTRYEEIRLGVQEALAGETKARRQNDNQQHEQQPRLNAEPPAPTTHVPSAASKMERTELSRRYNEFHALIVQTAKHFCVKGTPKCHACPLRPLLPPASRPS
jgi:endonuclease-3 related protein